MFKLLWLIQGGFLKGYRSQTIGIATGLGGPRVDMHVGHNRQPR
jgi:hypothetical protein